MFGLGNRPLRNGWIAGILCGALAACSASSSSATGGEGTLFTAAPQAGGGVGGKVVAQLSVVTPSTSTFVLRGTIPVPAGTFPRPDNLEPFSIRNWDGIVVPTQVEVVSRFPNEQDGADVVEVIGRVDVPPGSVPEALLTYEVVEDPHKEGRLPAKGKVTKLVTSPGNVLLVGEDCFGHRYSVDLFKDARATSGQVGNSKLLRSGVGAVTIRTYDVMKPSTNNVGAPSGALKHLFGVHAYMTAWAWTESVSLDLRVNNAASGLDENSVEDDPLGKAYFESLELWVPKGWTVVPDVQDPFIGTSRDEGAWTAFEIVRPLAQGKMHVMPAQSSFVRRLALTTVGNEAQARSLVNEEWLGFVQRGSSPNGGELYSWWNPQTAAYFPQRQRLPELDFLGAAQIAGVEQKAYATSRNVLQTGQGTGNYPYDSNVLGWAHPWGVPYGGMTGGSEIFMYDGFRVAEVGSRVGYKHLQNTHRMYVSRQADKLFDKDGEPTCVENWLINGSQGPYVNMQYFQVLLNGSPDPFGMSTSPDYQRDHVTANGMQPGYESALYSHSPIDFQHYVRFTRAPKALAWLGNDPLAKDELRAAAEVFHMSYHEHPTSAGGAVIVSGYLHDKNVVEDDPGIGFHFGRGESWGTDCAAAAYSVAEKGWRAAKKPWFDQIADTIAAGQSSCNGIIQSHVNNKWLNGEYKARQSIEQAITENMLYGLNESVFVGVDPGREAGLDYVLAQSTSAMIGPMCWSTGSNGGVGPHAHAAVAPLAGAQPYCGSLPPGGAGNGIDKYQVWSSFAYGLEKTGNPDFLTKAGQLVGGGGTLWNQMQAMGFNNLENRLALLAAMQ
jgi:hypothetical protein